MRLVSKRKKAKAPKVKNIKKNEEKIKLTKLTKASKKADALKLQKIAEEKKAKEDLKRAEEEQKRRMQQVAKILSDCNVRQNLIEVGGENALAIVRNFYGNCSDDEIAKKLKIKISDVRATLNKLHNEGLVNYMREKDNETGWYSYSWSLNHGRMEKWASSQTGKANAVSDGGEYYFCSVCGISTLTNFESAANVEFRCDRCNRLLEYIDEKKMNELYEKAKS